MAVTEYLEAGSKVFLIVIGELLLAVVAGIDYITSFGLLRSVTSLKKGAGVKGKIQGTDSDACSRREDGRCQFQVNHEVQPSSQFLQEVSLVAKESTRLRDTVLWSFPARLLRRARCSQVRTMMSLPTTIPSTARVANEFTSSQASGRLSNSEKRLASRLAARQGTVLPHLRPSLDLCHPAQYRRVADEWVTQMLRQGDGQVFKKYSQMKLQMKREGLEKLNRRANEMPLKKQVIELAPSACSEHDMGTVLARSRPEIIVRSGNKVGKYFRINPASHVGA